MNNLLKYVTYLDNDGNIIYYCNDRSTIEDMLKLPEYRLFVCKQCGDNKVEKTELFSNESFIPDIAIVLEHLGCEIYTFQEMEELFHDVFENDDMYLPFDTDELHYTYNGEYMGFCYRNDIQFTLGEYNYFFGLIKTDKEEEEQCF